jgi:hypothetical protein
MEEDDDHEEGSEVQEKKKKKRKKTLEKGSNSQANRMMRAVMPLWLGNPIGPGMGDGPARNVRNQLAAQGIQRYQVAGMLSMAPSIAAGTDGAMDQRLRSIGLTTDKVEKVISRVFSCISRSLTQSGLADKSVPLSSSDKSVLAWRPQGAPRARSCAQLHGSSG